MREVERRLLVLRLLLLPVVLIFKTELAQLGVERGDERSAVGVAPPHRQQTISNPVSPSIHVSREIVEEEKEETASHHLKSLSFSSIVYPVSPPSSTVLASTSTLVHLSKFSLCRYTQNAKLGASCTH